VLDRSTGRIYGSPLAKLKWTMRPSGESKGPMVEKDTTGRTTEVRTDQVREPVTWSLRNAAKVKRNIQHVVKRLSISALLMATSLVQLTTRTERSNEGDIREWCT
jgi:hypothetical protein